MIDSHAHVVSEFYNNIEEIVNNAKLSNVKRIINCAEDIKTSKEVISLSRKYNIFLPAIGIHPANVADVTKENIDELEDLISDGVIAIGEIGLDYYYGKENRDKQIEVFKWQLNLAEKYNLPVIIHSREATFDTLNILNKYDLKGVIHCFSGSVETALEFIKMGYKLGVNGIVTFKNSKNVKEVVKKLGIGNFVVETDCPFLTPEPYRKYRNEPKYVNSIVNYLANLLEISEEEIINENNRNICEVFDFKEGL